MGNLKIKRENDRIFKSGNFCEMHSETIAELAEPVEIRRKEPFVIAEHTEKITTIESILVHSEKKVIALNFANAMYPGGGYALGGDAQEESLCRASLLYYTIKMQKQYYRKNRLHILPDYTDLIIYSENVPIIRNDRGELLKEALSCDFITCPAVNRTFARFMFSERNIDRKMYGRIKRIIMLAVMKSPDIVVLGAFGCGMFGNKRKKILPMFEELINKYFPDNIEVFFAIP